MNANKITNQTMTKIIICEHTFFIFMSRDDYSISEVPYSTLIINKPKLDYIKKQKRYYTILIFQFLSCETLLEHYF